MARAARAISSTRSLTLRLRSRSRAPAAPAIAVILFIARVSTRTPSPNKLLSVFTVGKHLISLYIGSSNMASTYGAAGAVIVVFVWVYYSAQILLLGAEFAKAHSDQMQALRELQQTTRIAS